MQVGVKIRIIITFSLINDGVQEIHPSCCTWAVYKEINTNHISFYICLALLLPLGPRCKDFNLPILWDAGPELPLLTPGHAAHRISGFV